MAGGTDRLNFTTRYGISGQMLQLLIAGAVALAVLVAGVVALPRNDKAKTAGSRASGLTAGDNGSATGSSAPGTATTGNTTSPAAATGGGSSYASSGGGSSGGAPAGGNAAHVSSKFLAAKAPGITNTTIYVGVGYSSQSAAGDRAIGAAGAAPSYDYRNVFNSIADYANKHGGFAGRRACWRSRRSS